MELLVMNRVHAEGNALMGMMIQVGGGLIVVTMEDRANAVPEGTYALIPDDTGRHRHWRLIGARVSSEPEPWSEWCRVEIHAGNVESDSDACILPGISPGYMNGELAVQSSSEALRRMHTAMGEGNHILTIKDSLNLGPNNTSHRIVSC